MGGLHIPDWNPHECVPTQDAYDAAVRALEKHRERANVAEEVAKKLATALDDLGARIYRDINPDSSYQPVDERMAKVLGDFTSFAEEQLAVLDDRAVRAVLKGAVR